jgi:hypothetical protein
MNTKSIPAEKVMEGSKGEKASIQRIWNPIPSEGRTDFLCPKAL